MRLIFWKFDVIPILTFFKNVNKNLLNRAINSKESTFYN